MDEFFCVDLAICAEFLAINPWKTVRFWGVYIWGSGPVFQTLILTLRSGFLVCDFRVGAEFLSVDGGVSVLFLQR